MMGVARHLLTLCAAASMLLCVSACVFWVRSWRVSDHVRSYQPGDGREHGVLSSAGSTSIYRVAWKARSADSREPSTFRHHRQGDPEGLHRRLRVGDSGPMRVYGPRGGFGLSWRWANVWGNHAWEVMVPHWFWVAVTAVPPLWWLRRERRRRLARGRSAAGRCPRCGYDLRASPERCPECGAATPAEG